MVEIIDNRNYMPIGTHPFHRLKALQLMLIDSQNVLYERRDITRDELAAECEEVPCTYAKLRRHKEIFTLLIEAVERGCGKDKGEEECDIMHMYVRFQLAREHEKPYMNEGTKAVTDTPNTLSKKQAASPE